MRQRVDLTREALKGPGGGGGGGGRFPFSPFSVASGGESLGRVGAP